MVYNGTNYYYLRNAQGDILGIVNAYGAVVASYTYDAWGNVLSVTGSMSASLGTLNPLRYRGYVYDTETKLYYLNSRYYNPSSGGLSVRTCSSAPARACRARTCSRIAGIIR